MITEYFHVLLILTSLWPGLPTSHKEAPLTPQERYGSIEGSVLTSEGVPVAGAWVYSFDYGPSMVTKTNANGRFTLSSLSQGKHLILAYKQSDRFPNPVSTFYSEAPKAEPFPVIDVQEGQTVTGVIIRLGPKASQLLIRIIDSTTRRPITDAEVSMNHLGKPFTLLKTGANTLQGDFRYEVLVPAEVPLELRVTAQRYEAWRYQGKLLFTPNSRKELLVSLRRRAR